MTSNPPAKPRTTKTHRVMFWLWTALIALAALLVVVFVGGRFLPERYVGEVTLTFAKPPAAVWAALVDYRTHPVGGSMCRHVDALPQENGLDCWTEDLGSSKTTIRTLETDPGRHLKRSMQDAVVPMTGTSEVWLEPTADGTGTRVRARNELTVKPGTWHVSVFRVMLMLASGARRGVEAQWRRIAKTLDENAVFTKS